MRLFHCNSVDERLRPFCNAIDDRSESINYPYVGSRRFSCEPSSTGVQYTDTDITSLAEKIISDRRHSQSNSWTPLYEFWKQHDTLSNICCYANTNYHLTYLEQLINFDNDFYNLIEGVTTYNTPGLQSEIVALCSDEQALTTSKFCAFKPIIAIVGMSAQLPSSRLQWTDENERYAHVVSVTVILLKKQYPEVFSNLNIDEGNILVRATNDIIKLVRENELDSLQTFISSLLRSLLYIDVNLCSESTQDICIFFKIVKEASTYIREANLNEQIGSSSNGGKRIVKIDTGTDYSELLKQKRLDRILTVLTETQYTITEIANDLKSQMASNFLQIRDYFQDVETFNSRIAKADIGYIKGRLELFKSIVDELLTKLSHDLGDLIKQGFIIAGSDIAQNTVELALSFASACNPLKQIFGGGSVTEILNAMTNLINAVSRIARMSNVHTSLVDLKQKTLQMRVSFEVNHMFLENVRKLIEEDYTTYEFGRIRETFLQQYNSYNPQVTKDELLGNQAVWTGLVEATCDVIDDAESVIGASTKVYVEGKGYCIDIPALIERLFGVFGEIYDYQFELMSAMASYMRTLVGIESAENIDGTFVEVAGLNPDQDSTLSKLSLMGGLSYMTYKTQVIKTINLYCDRLEYQDGDVRPSECKGVNTNVDLLLSKNIQDCNAQTHTFYYNVPTVPANSGNSYIDLKQLFSGNEVPFQIPNSQWLVDRNWIGSHEKDYAIYIEQFEIYLPIEAQGNIQTFHTIAVPFQNIAITPGGTEYLITPSISLSHEYRMASFNQACYSKTNNPYTTCENDGILEICPVSIPITRELYPSIYSRWHLKVLGAENLTPPNPATDLSITFGLKLCKKTPGSSVVQEKSTELPAAHSMQSVATCCPNGQYGPYGVSCAPCPADSRSALSGYYCEKQ